MGNQIPGQMSVNDVPGVVPENVVEVEGKTVDTDTGEIVGNVRLDDGEMNVDSLDSTEYSTESIQDEIMYIAA